MAEQYSKIFEAKFPGISVRVERSGAERIFSRIAQEYASRIFNVDLVNTTDAAHVLAWKREGWLAPYVPADAAQHFAPRPYRSRRHLRDAADPVQRHRLQHPAGEAARRAGRLHRPARPEMDGQAGEGASGLLRPDPDRHARHGARARLGLLREARQAEGDAGAVRRRPAQEGGARRAGGDGRRRRLHRAPAEGQGRADRGGLSGRRARP